MSQSLLMASPHLVEEAESLIRSLAGVVTARVHGSAAGIDAIHVEVDEPTSADAIAGHVRSALLAGLATPVTPGRIHVRVAGADPAAADQPVPRQPLRLVQDGESHAPGSPRATEDRARSVTALPRLVAADVARHGDGRVLCVVTVAYRTDVFQADAVAVDLPGAAAQAAAQATVRALAFAGIDGLELDGLRETEIAGREFVLVALRRADGYTRLRSGSAPIIGAPERAAALAVVDAARKMT